MIQNQDVILEINGFQIDLTQEISRGAQGQIFACKSKQNTNQQFCAKIITILDDNQKFCKREKKIGEMISNNQKNPNLVAIYQIDQIEDKIVIIMERCEGNLHQLMEQKKFNDFEIFDFIQQFLNGYKTLYDLKIIHKDIKPENILIKNENGKIIYKITDFGISKIQENVGDKDITRQGTKAYSAPEVGLIIQDQEIQQNLSHIQDQSVIDIYSLGLMLYQLIFQKLPFQTKRIQIQRFFEETKKSPLKIKENTQYARLIEKMLLYNPQERYSFLELNQQLQQFKLQNDSQPEFKQVLNQNRPSILETEIEQNQNQENKNSIFNNQNDNKQQIYNSQQKLNCQFKPIKDNKQQLNQNQVNQNGNLQFQNDIKQQFNNNQQNNNLNFQPTKDNNQQFNSKQVNSNNNLQFQNDIKQQFNNNQQNNNLNFQPTKDNNQQFNSKSVNSNNNLQFQNDIKQQFNQQQQNSNENEKGKISPFQQNYFHHQKLNPHQIIKEYINCLLLQFKNAFNDQIKQLFIQLSSQDEINSDQIKRLQDFFPIDISRLNQNDSYDLRFLNFQYSLIELIQRPQSRGLIQKNVFEIRNELRNYYQNKQ